jgi:hypothetical protein
LKKVDIAVDLVRTYTALEPAAYEENKVFNTEGGTRRPATLAAIVALCAAGSLYSSTFSGPRCMAQTAIASNFNGTPINGGNFIWFNANLTAKGIPATGAKVFFRNSTIQFVADQGYNLAVPNAQITFDPSATCVTTSYDPVTNTFFTTVPVSGSDEIFLTGRAFAVPASIANVGGRVNGSVIWQGTLGSDNEGISVSWKWGAAVYTTFSSDYNALQIVPAHGNSCSPSGGNHAGTPHAFTQFVVGGARGGGGSNFTGSWSGTETVSIDSCH